GLVTPPKPVSLTGAIIHSESEGAPPEGSDILFYLYPTTSLLYTLSLHVALPISMQHSKIRRSRPFFSFAAVTARSACSMISTTPDRKSTRLNSSHDQISYAVFFWKKIMLKDVHVGLYRYQPPTQAGGVNPLSLSP